MPSSPAPARRNVRVRPDDIVIIIVAIALTLLYVLSVDGGFPLDDSWIHQTYARNLGQTGEWAFLSGVPSAASTSPLYTVLLAIGYRVGIPFLLWTHGLGALALIATGLIGGRLVERVLDGRRYARLIGGLALVTAWHLLWAAASGMETMIFALFTLVLIALVWRELDPQPGGWRGVQVRGVVFGIAAGLTTLARPEGALLVGLCGIALLIARPHLTWPQIINWGGVAIAAFLLTLSPYLLFNLGVTGGLLPTTSAAKQAFARPILELGYPWRVGQMVTPLLAGGQFLLIPGIAIYAAIAVRRGGARSALLYLLPLLWGGGLILLYAAWLPLPFQHGRYVIPALPALITAGVIGTAALWRWSRRRFLPRVIVTALSGAAALLFLAFALVTGLAAHRLDVAIIDQEMVAAAAYIRENVSADELLVIHDIGAVGYFAPRPMLDIAGLISPEVIPLIGNADGLWALMEQRGGRYLLAFTDQIPNDDPTDPRLCPLYQSPGNAALIAGGTKMVLYGLAWDRQCP